MQIGVISFENYQRLEKKMLELVNVVKEIGLDENMTLSLVTCYRCEIYFYSQNLEEKKEKILKRVYKKLNTTFLDYKFFENIDCFTHLSSLASGLKSPILGETHIVFQIRKAYLQCIEKKEIHSELHYLFQKSFRIAKRFKYNSDQNSDNVSLEKWVVEKISKILNKTEKILLIGSSEINRTILNQLLSMGYKNFDLVTDYDSALLACKVKKVYSYKDCLDFNNYKALIIASSNSYYLDAITNISSEIKIIVDLSMPSLVRREVIKNNAVFFDLNNVTNEIKSRQKHLEEWSESRVFSIKSEVEKYVLLFYLRLLKKDQLLLRN